MLVLVIGDLDIPFRAMDIPKPWLNLWSNGKIQMILCTGNICSDDVLDYLKVHCCSDIRKVKGDMDDFIGMDGKNEKNELEERCLQIGPYRFGLIHGHGIVPQGEEDILYLNALKLNVDVLIYGHSHALEVNHYLNKLFINPGSATGVYGGKRSDEIPSFVLMDVQEENIMVYSYQWIDEQVKIHKLEYKKPYEKK